MRRALLVLALAALVAAGAAQGGLRLPREHYPHAGAGIEWWYFTGLARAPGGPRYAYFFTLFESGTGFLALANVVDLESGRTVGHTEQAGFGRAPADRLDLRVAGAHLRYAGGAWRFGVDSPRFALDLRARPLKPYVEHGEGGTIEQSSGGPSRYYSATRMAAAGTMRLGRKTLRLAGDGWLDRQWGDFRDSRLAFTYDWFSCRFADRTELMLYRFRDRAGRVLRRYATGTYVRADGSRQLVRRFTATPLGRVFAGRYPLDWRLEVPALRLRFEARAIVPDQLVRNRSAPTFWEGAAVVRGPKGGYCFVEQTSR